MFQGWYTTVGTKTTGTWPCELRPQLAVLQGRCWFGYHIGEHLRDRLDAGSDDGHRRKIHRNRPDNRPLQERSRSIRIERGTSDSDSSYQSPSAGDQSARRRPEPSNTAST
jgi:hypothetical protein